MARPKVIVTRRWPETVERKLTELFDAQLNKDDRPMTVPELQSALRSADCVMPTVSDRITAEVLSAEPLKCRIIGNFGVGFNHIDLAAAKSRGIAVTNTPAVLTDCTAATDRGNYEAALKMVKMQGGVFGAVASSADFIGAVS